MARFRFRLADGQEADLEVPDVARDYYRIKPGYVEIIDSDAAEELKGDALDQAAREHGIPTSLHADEKRAAIVEATEPTDPDSPKPARARTTPNEEK